MIRYYACLPLGLLTSLRNADRSDTIVPCSDVLLGDPREQNLAVLGAVAIVLHVEVAVWRQCHVRIGDHVPLIEQKSGAPSGTVVIRKIGGEMRAPVASAVNLGTVLNQQQAPGMQAANVETCSKWSGA